MGLFWPDSVPPNQLPFMEGFRPITYCHVNRHVVFQAHYFGALSLPNFQMLLLPARGWNVDGHTDPLPVPNIGLFDGLYIGVIDFAWHFCNRSSINSCFRVCTA